MWISKETFEQSILDGKSERSFTYDREKKVLSLLIVINMKVMVFLLMKIIWS